MNCYRSSSPKWGASLFAALLVGLCAVPSYAVVLLDDDYEDGLFLFDDDPNGGVEVPNLPDETIIWYGRPAEAIEGIPGTARLQMNASSQKAWINFAPASQFSYLNVGDSLSARIDYIPRGAFTANTSRNWRWGLFNDPTDPVVEVHTNSDGGGTGNPYTDASGYVTFINMTGEDGNTSSTTLQQAGKRTSQTTTSLMGSGGAHTLINGGSEIVHSGNNEYTLEMIVTRVSDSLTTFVTTIYDKTGGDTVLSTQTVSDDGAALGTGAANRRFSFIGFRDSGASTSFAFFDVTRVVVEGPALVPEPATLLLGALVAPLAMLRRRR